MSKYFLICCLFLLQLTADAKAAELPSSLLGKISGQEEPFRTLVLVQGSSSTAIELLMNEGKMVTMRTHALRNLDKKLTDEISNISLDPEKSGTVITILWQNSVGASLDIVLFVSTIALERIFNEKTTEDTLPSKLSSEVKRILDDPVYRKSIQPIISNLIAEKLIFFTGVETELEAELTALGLSAALPKKLPANTDVLMVTGAQGASIRLFTTIENNGKIKNRLRIVGIPDRSSTRMLVPFGSKLLKTRGIDRKDFTVKEQYPFLIFSHEKTPGNSSAQEIEIFYQLPFTFDVKSSDTYRMNILKQPGAAPMLMKHAVEIPSFMSLFEKNPKVPYFELRNDLESSFTAGKNP